MIVAACFSSHSWRVPLTRIFASTCFGSWLGALPVTTLGAVDLSESVRLVSYADVRAYAGSFEPTWLENGLGRTRYGDSDGTEAGARLAEAGIVLDWRLARKWHIHAHISATPDAPDPLDIPEVVLRWRGEDWHLNAGIFFGNISQENTLAGWRPEWSITPSAINNWFGEEVRSIGLETGYEIQDGWRVSALVFAANDPTGSLLAWCGWSVSDIRSGLIGSLPLPEIPSLADGGSFDEQAAEVRPIKEIDNRPGLQLSTSWRNQSLKVRLELYDNFADQTAFDDGEYAWRTQFVHGGMTWELNESWSLLSQVILGRTRMGPGTLVDVPFVSAYALLGRQWNTDIGVWRLAGRLEYFSTSDDDTTADDPNAGQGWSAMLATTWQPNDWLRLLAEGVVIDSERDVYVSDAVESRSATEYLLQVAAIAQF
jgi:hypothetical protein